MSTRSLIDSYYDSLKGKDEKWIELWSDDAFFSDASQTLRAQGKDAVIQSFTPFLKTVADLKVSQRILQDDRACFIISYTYVNPNMQKMHQDVAEVWRVSAGRLAELTIYFDLTAYRQFMRG